MVYVAPKLDFRMPPKRTWEVLAASVRKDRRAHFNLGCMLRQIVAQKAYEHLGCRDLAGVCERLEISERRGRRLIHFALLTLDAQRIVPHNEPEPLSSVEFGERLYLARQKISAETYGELVREYYALGSATDALEEKLAKLTGKNKGTVSNLNRLNLSRAKSFLGFLANEPWPGALVDFDLPQILQLSTAKKKEVLEAMKKLQIKLNPN